MLRLTVLRWPPNFWGIMCWVAESITALSRYQSKIMKSTLLPEQQSNPRPSCWSFRRSAAAPRWSQKEKILNIFAFFLFKIHKIQGHFRESHFKTGISSASKRISRTSYLEAYCSLRFYWIEIKLKMLKRMLLIAFVFDNVHWNKSFGNNLQFIL